MTQRLILAPLIALLLFFSPPILASKAPPEELSWDDLVPPEWRPDEGRINALLEEYQFDQMEDDDPRADELRAKLDAILADAPVVEALHGKRVRLPGYVVPLGAQAGEIKEFLLVPYYGACIHVPPPPPNETVHVVIKGKPFRGTSFDVVHVTGLMKVERSQSALAEAGYRIDAEVVEPYR
jgi:uncharacterized protein